MDPPFAVYLSTVLYALTLGLVLARAGRAGPRGMWIAAACIAFAAFVVSLALDGVPLYTHWCWMLCGYGWFVFWKSFAMATVLVAGSMHLLARVRVPLLMRVATAALLALPPLLAGRGFWIN